MKIGENIGNRAGPKPGSRKAIRQHQFIAEGYTVPDTERRVKVFQREHETGEVESPGLTTGNVKMGMRR